MQGKRRFFFQGLLMTGVSLLLRTVGVSAGVIIAGRVGSEAVGISSLIGGVSGFAVTLALSGISPGTTYLVAEACGKEDASLLRRTLCCAFAYALFFGTLAGLLLFGLSRCISRDWLHDLRALPSLRIFALTLPLISLSGCIGGYFVAVRRVYKSATAQILEEFLRVGLTILLLDAWSSRGLPGALIALALSNAIADILSALLLYLLYWQDRHVHASPDTASSGSAISNPTVTRRLLSVTLPVALAAYARTGLITLEHALIPIGLERFGLTHSNALSAYGLLASMALPVVLFPAALLGAFASLLVPELTEADVKGQTVRITRILDRTFGVTLLYAIGCGGILFAFSHSLGMALYDDPGAAHYIRLLSPLIPVMYLDSATDAMLKGLGQHLYSMKVNILDALAAVLLVWLLVPRMGIIGYVITIYLTELFNAALSILRLLQLTRLRPRLWRDLALPLFAVIGATGLTRLCYQGLSSHLDSLPLWFFFALLVYFALLCLFGRLRRRELRWMLSFLVPDSKKKGRSP